MQGKSFYSIGSYDVTGDVLDISDNIFADLDDAIASLNNELGYKIRELFGVELSAESYFTENKNQKYEHRFITRENNIMEIVKRNWIIDIYIEEVKKGYVYNSYRKSHIMKFFIKKHDSVLLSEEEESDFSLVKVKDTTIESLHDKISEDKANSQIKKTSEDIEKYSLKYCKVTPIENIENKTFEQVLHELRDKFI